MRIFNIILVICINLLFNGCNASTYNEMMNDSNVNKKEFKVNQNFIDLYKDSVTRIEPCYDVPMIGSSFRIDGEIITERGEASIKIYISGTVKRFINVVKINKIDENNSNLTIYSYSNEERINVIKKELTGECNCYCE